MPYEGWVSYAGTELVNTSRTAVYSGVAGAGCACPALGEGLRDAPYTTPELDKAPWFDPSVVESGRFFGLVGLGIRGADTGTLEYQWTELLSDGGVPGAGRRGSKEIEVRALAAAADGAAMSYGMGWLASALRGSTCRDACFGDDLCLLAACPQPAGSYDLEWQPEAGSQYAPGVDRLMRTAHNVTLLEGPEVTNRYFLGGQVIHELRFTLRAGVPYWYRQTLPVAKVFATQQPGEVGVYRDELPNYDPWGWQANCPAGVTCLDDDPFCVNPPVPPAAVVSPPDPCFPNDPRNNPPANPNAHKFNASRIVFSVPRGVGTTWGEKVPVLQLFTGSLPWHRTIIRFYDNPAGQACGGNLNPCDACAEINVPYLPRSTVFTLDGRVQRAYADCPGTGPLVEPRIYGPAGGPFSYPTFECSSGLCVEVLVSRDWLAFDGWFDMSMATREDAI